MPRLSVFENIGLDGYYADREGRMDWAHIGAEDEEFQAFTNGNAEGGGRLVFGRVTYEMMAGFWSSSAAKESMPVVAAGMNAMRKIVFSRTLVSADWQNSTLVGDDLIGTVARLKADGGPDMAIMGSGTIVAQLAEARLLDEIQIVVNPIILGGGKSLFGGVADKLPLRLTQSRAFRNGKVVLSYEPA